MACLRVTWTSPGTSAAVDVFIQTDILLFFLWQGATGIKMKSILFYALLVMLCVHEGAPYVTPSYGERGSDLGMQVFEHVVRTKPLDNVVLSPHGVASILGMLLPGAHGETRKQIIGSLRYKKKGE